jgi:hypothetical protein
MMLDASSVKPTAAAYPTHGQARMTITKATWDVLVIGQVLTFVLIRERGDSECRVPVEKPKFLVISKL